MVTVHRVPTESVVNIGTRMAITLTDAVAFQHSHLGICHMDIRQHFCFDNVLVAAMPRKSLAHPFFHDRSLIITSCFERLLSGFQLSLWLVLAGGTCLFLGVALRL